MVEVGKGVKSRGRGGGGGKGVERVFLKVHKTVMTTCSKESVHV